MRFIAGFIRLLIVAVFAAGIGFPATSFASAPITGADMAQMPMHAAHHIHDAGKSVPMDEACRDHCLGVSMLISPIAPAPCIWRATPVHVVAMTKDEPSLWPQPERHPPRA